jgi:hypothetical protein
MKPVMNQLSNFASFQVLQAAFSRFCSPCRRVITSTPAIAVAALLVLTSLFIAPAIPAYAQTATLTPRQVTEYALTLEKLEADFYRRAVAAAQTGALRSAPQVAKNALISYGQDEAQHVTDLSAVLRSIGGDPDAIVLPQNPNYSAILGRDPFANPTDLLLAGQYVEDLGVAAYKGQVQNLVAAGEAGKPILAAALAIHSVEARHAAGIRFLRQTLLAADERPWIRSASSVIYNENRSAATSSSSSLKQMGSTSIIPFSSEAFDGYATESEVLALVRPILTVASSPTRPNSTQTEPMPSTSQPIENSTSDGIRALW